MSTNPLHKLMNPRSVATVGAGNNPMKMGTLQALSILKDGFQGKFYPVHPREKEVLGHKAYPSVADLPEAPDLAVLIVPTDQVIGLIEDFGRLGTKYAVIISAGFRERGPEGAELENRLKSTAERYGLRFLGPNCMGIINTQIGLNTTVNPLDKRPGHLGMASQSGTYVTQTLSYLRKKGIRFSKAISVGNEANIDIIDALEYLGEDEATRAISLYIEGIRDVRRFIETAQKITPHKPVIAQYVGGSEAGARAGASHTGSMAGPDYLYDGMFRQAGIIKVDSVEQLYDYGWTLATQPLLKGRRIGVITNSGGPGTAISHTSDSGGLEIPLFSDKLQEEIRPHLAPQASSANPVDLTFHMDSKPISEIIPEIVLKSGEVDGLILHGAMSEGFMKELYPHIKELIGNIPLEALLDSFRRDLSAVTQLPRKYGVPMVVSSFFGREDNYTSAYMDADIPVLDAPEKAARAMLSLLRYKEIRERGAVTPPQLPAAAAEAAEIIRRAKAGGRKTLDEFEAKRVLSCYGIPVPAEKRVYSAGEAAAAAEEIGFPVAVKGCSPDILHKTEKGLVILDCKDARETEEAFDLIQKRAGEAIPVLVSAMVPGRREFIAGMTAFPGFGPCVLFGLGGVFAEVLKDVTFRVAPLGAVEAREMLHSIRGKSVLSAFRGEPAVDEEALAALVQKLSFIGVLHPQIREIDCNPVKISGSGPVVADALVVLSED